MYKLKVNYIDGGTFDVEFDNARDAANCVVDLRIAEKITLQEGKRLICDILDIHYSPK